MFYLFSYFDSQILKQFKIMKILEFKDSFKFYKLLLEIFIANPNSNFYSEMIESKEIEKKIFIEIYLIPLILSLFVMIFIIFIH